jgi:Protein of unknown function (DUF2924)
MSEAQLQQAVETPAAAPLEAELARLDRLGHDELRALWRAMTWHNAPKALSRDLLARMLAYRVQEQALGKLGREIGKLLERLAQGGTEPVRHLKVGTVMVREHQGTLHEVMVVPGGFCWRETTYASLSAIAQAITGTTRNGPRFFWPSRPVRLAGRRPERRIDRGGKDRAVEAKDRESYRSAIGDVPLRAGHLQKMIANSVFKNQWPASVGFTTL